MVTWRRSAGKGRNWLTGTIVVLPLTCAVFPATAVAAAPLKLQLLPADVTVNANGTGRLTVLATNVGDDTLRHLRLTTRWMAGTKVVGRPPEGTIDPGETSTLTVTVHYGGETTKTLTLLASYETEAGADQTVGTTVKINRPQPSDPAESPSLEVKASLMSLRSGHEQHAYLIVDDKAATPLEIEGVVVEGPGLIHTVDRPTEIFVPPGGTKVVPVQVKVEDSVEPGEHELVFKLRGSAGGHHLTLVDAETAKVAVTGETELLTVLGIPSILLVPGFLILGTCGILWNLRWRRVEWDGDDFPFPFTDPGFWVVAVTLSIAAVGLCEIFHMDLLGRYSLDQVLYLWGGSIVSGVGLYLAAVTGVNRWRDSRVPTEGDEPIEVLRKLDRQGLSLLRPAFIMNGTPTKRMFLLQPPSDTRPSTWACSKINLSRKNVSDDMDQAIQQQLDVLRDPKALADLLTKGVAAKEVTVTFKGDGPTLVRKEIGDTTAEQIVELDD
jgi:hypothetical protein